MTWEPIAIVILLAFIVGMVWWATKEFRAAYMAGTFQEYEEEDGDD